MPYHLFVENIWGENVLDHLNEQELHVKREKCVLFNRTKSQKECKLSVALCTHNVHKRFKFVTMTPTYFINRMGSVLLGI